MGIIQGGAWPWVYREGLRWIIQMHLGLLTGAVQEGPGRREIQVHSVELTLAVSICGGGGFPSRLHLQEKEAGLLPHSLGLQSPVLTHAGLSG